jgi:hypothetical protein
MTRTRLFLAALITGSVAFYSGNALALLGFDVVSGMQAQGTVLGATPQTITDEEVTPPPFARSIVSVANSGTVPDPFQYAASADIGNLELKVFGTYTNNSGSPGNIEIPLMSVHSHVRDVITLNSTLPDPYEVTLELDVNGSISTSGGAASASANSFLEFGAPPSVSRRYEIGPINDTLSITRTVSGPSVDLGVDAFLTFNVFRVDPGATVTGDLGNTAFLRLILPDQGVTLASSASGTFGVPIPIPEPETYALMVAGLVLVGAAARRRHRS